MCSETGDRAGSEALISETGPNGQSVLEMGWSVVGLLAEYGVLLDAGDFEGWSELFVPDGTMELAPAVIRGREKLTRFAARSPQGIHVAGLPLISAADGVVGSVCSWVFVERDTGQAMAGYYRDQIVWDGDRYRFRTRRVEMNAAPPGG